MRRQASPIKLYGRVCLRTRYVDHMMDHTVNTYHDNQIKGVDFLRNIYAGSGSVIKPKTRVSKINAPQGNHPCLGIQL